MSTKLETVLQKHRSIYEAEKEKFLDALADFLSKCDTQTVASGTYYFAMSHDTVGTDFKFTLSWNTTNWCDFNEITPTVSIYTKIPPDTIFKILATEYKATIKPYNNYTTGYVKIKLPIV